MSPAAQAVRENGGTLERLILEGRSRGHEFDDGRRVIRAGITTMVYACRGCPAQILVRSGAGAFVRAHDIDRACPHYWGRSADGPEQPQQRSLLAAPPQPAGILLRRPDHAYSALDVQVDTGGYLARRMCDHCGRVSTYRNRVDEPDDAPCLSLLDGTLPEVRALLARASSDRLSS
jgi:hypothetical protein